MHGIIHTEMKKYVVGKYGADAWEAILNEAGLKGKIYMTIGTYPDAEAVALVTAASKLTNLPAEDILEDFGQSVTPALMKMYGSLVKPEWKTTEMLLHTEETIHKIVRMKNPGAAPPQLAFSQTGAKQLELHYNSPRQMSAVARGIIKGVARYYGESVQIKENTLPDGAVKMSIAVH